MKEKIAIWAVIVNAILAAGKIAIGAMSGSALVLADGIHSLSDVFASGVGFMGIRIAQKPSDKEHPYGHYKYEVLSGLIITIILFGAGVGAIYEAYKSFISPAELKLLDIAVVVMIVSAITNEIMARIKINYGKKENSLSLLSDGIHSRVDVWASAAVVIGILLSRYWLYADATFALVVGLYVIKESFTLGKEAIDSLLDVSAGEAVENEIKAVINEHKVELVSLKTQRKGAIITANLEIAVSSSLKVEEVERISDSLRKELVARVKNLQYVVIEVKGHEMETDYYKPAVGRGFGWYRQGKLKTVVTKTGGAGPGGECVCPTCGYTTPHQPGVPCASISCPNCNAPLTRKIAN